MRYLGITVLFFFFSCTTQQKLQQDAKAIEIINKSIQTHGGQNNWDNKKHLTYTKDFTLLDADGNIEKGSEQKHDYSYYPSDIVHIETQHSNGDIESLI